MIKWLNSYLSWRCAKQEVSCYRYTVFRLGKSSVFGSMPHRSTFRVTPPLIYLSTSICFFLWWQRLICWEWQEHNTLGHKLLPLLLLLRFWWACFNFFPRHNKLKLLEEHMTIDWIAWLLPGLSNLSLSSCPINREKSTAHQSEYNVRALIESEGGWSEAYSKFACYKTWRYKTFRLLQH